jgi:hypothetical protein
MFPAAARSRLLPMSVPFRHFGAGALFPFPAWLLVFGFPEEFRSFTGGLGPLFAALHLVTLGSLAMVAMGASLQLLPVATRQPVRSVAAAKLAWWLFVPGVAIFAFGAARYSPQVMGAGATLVVAAFALYGVLLFRNLLGARGMPVVVRHGWAALACLAGLAFTGLALVARYEHGLALDYPTFRTAHVVLAAYGFMGLMALGLSNFLLPMLALAPAPKPAIALAVLGTALAAIALAAFGLVVAAAIAGFVAAAAHVVSLERSLARRLRKPLGPGFALVRLSWACLLASLVLAALPQSHPLLFGVLLVPGWLLTFLLGVLQRILPFLGSVHASSAARGTPLISALTPVRLLALHRALHLGALALLFGAALFRAPALAGIGAAAGLVAAVAFAAFYTYVVLKVRSHANAYPPSQPAPA